MGRRRSSSLNEALLAKAAAAKVLKTNRVRADTTVVEANVAYPTDSGLLAKRRGKDGEGGEGAQGMPALLPARRPGTAPARCTSALVDIGANLRRRSGEAKDEVMAINAELAASPASDRRGPSEWCATPGGRAPLGACAPRKLVRAISDLEITAERVEIIARRLVSVSPAATPDGAKRLVSLHDPDARPIRKGRLGKPVEFGYKAQVVDNEDGVVLDHNVEIGNPHDAAQLVPAIVRRITTRVGKVPRAVTADRGYGEHAVERELEDLGVRNVVLPTKGKPNAARRTFEQRPIVSTTREVADRMRRSDQLPETRLWMEPNAHGRNRRSTNLVRTRGVQPQPRQDRRTDGRGLTGEHDTTTRVDATDAEPPTPTSSGASS